MIALLGYAGVLVALISSIVLIVGGVRSCWFGASRAPVRWGVWGLLAGAVVAMGALELALLTNDFSIEYVAENNSRATPLVFTIASGWAALEGSIVLWGLVLAGYIAWTWRRSHGDRSTVLAMAVLGVIAAFFFGLMATAANPFTTLDVVPPDGIGPNPLLQNNLLMAVHPPLLYLGFVGMSVPFAYAIAALVNGEPGSAWLQRTHRTTLVAWTFLTAGIALGALWSYVVLGWGGYWAWDPVENAAILPWFAATAFIHSAVVQRRRGMLAAWNLTLIIATFSLTILGTFLTRSGVVASVHSFTQSAVGPAILAFLGVVIAGSLVILATRVHLVASVPRLDSLASREGVFLVNNLLLTIWLLVVLLGTLYPILVEAFSGDQVSVGRPFFDSASAPIAVALLLAMGLGPITPYRKASPEVMWERLRGPLAAALAVTAVVAVLGLRLVPQLVVLFLASLVVSAILRHLWWLARRSAAANETGTARAALRLAKADRGYWGGQLAHVGFALVALAIAAAAPFVDRAEVILDVGDSATFGRYEVTYLGPFTQDDGYRSSLGADVRLARDGEPIAVLRPRLNRFPGYAQAVGTPAVHPGIVEDVYVTLTRIDADGIALDLFRNPLMWQLWLGGALIVAGGGWALTARVAERDRSPALTAP